MEALRSVGHIPVLDLVCIEDDSQGETICVTLAPEVGAEVLDPQDWSPLLRVTFEGPERLGAYLRATEWRTASAADRRLFQAPFRAGIRLDAYQLLPLAKALELPRVNLLIADDVGLGKTVEAGLIVREMLLRRRVEIIVVAAPASMLLQWQDELTQKFGLDFTIVDRDHLLDTRRTRGFSANPWSIGSRFIVSHSVLSDDVYMSGLRDLLGEFRARSMFILDEAHHAAPSAGAAWATESQMTRAVRDVAGRFEHRLFLSATPHNGHSNSFATLLEILDPQRFHRGIEVEPKELEPVMVRRLKEDLRRLGQPFAERIVEPIRIDDLPPDAPELRLAAMLDVYRGASLGGTRARFLFANLQQRLFSSIAAFDRTLATHRKTLLRKRDELPDPDTAVPELLDDDDHIDAVTEGARRTDPAVWQNFDPALMTLCSPDPQAFRPPEEPMNVLQVTLPTNFKAARFANDANTAILRQMQTDIEAVRYPIAGRQAELPVKLKVHDSIFVPLAKWAMLLTGNYRCVQSSVARSIREAVHTDVEESRLVYAWVCEVCLALGASPDDMVPFEKYANAAQGLARPSSAARALFAGARNIERVDRLVQAIAAQKGMRNAIVDETVAMVDARLAVNRKAAA